MRPVQAHDFLSEKSMEPNTNWVVRLLTVLLCFFLGGLIAYRFFAFSPHGDLGPSLLS